MANEVRPMGVACNLKCTYCYQNPLRDAGNINTLYDLEKIIEQLDKTTSEFHLFGGEALLIPKKDLEVLWSYGLKRFGQNGIQTNGVLIDAEHVELFKKYKVSVGISIDGPAELNDMRWAGSLDKTREATQKIMDNIVMLANEGVQMGIIITIHKLNGMPEHLPRLLNFIRWLGDIGVKGGNIHTLEVDNEIVRNMFCLTEEENLYAFLTLAQFFQENPDLSWNPFGEIYKLLQGDDYGANCNFKRCDSMNTQAVYGIEGNGALSNCSRTNKEGIDMYKADDHGYERYISLYHTPPEYGGCNGCRFWSICGGSCPGESVNGDFRNKTIHCQTMKGILGFYEEVLESEGIQPITKHPNLYEYEREMLKWMAQGQNCLLSDAIRMVDGRGENGEIRVVPVYRNEGRE